MLTPHLICFIKGVLFGGLLKMFFFWCSLLTPGSRKNCGLRWLAIQVEYVVFFMFHPSDKVVSFGGGFAGVIIRFFHLHLGRSFLFIWCICLHSCLCFYDRLLTFYVFNYCRYIIGYGGNILFCYTTFTICIMITLLYYL